MASSARLSRDTAYLQCCSDVSSGHSAARGGSLPARPGAALCRLVTPEARESFGASSLATIVQMVSHGYGITLLPEIAVAS